MAACNRPSYSERLTFFTIDCPENYFPEMKYASILPVSQVEIKF